MNDERFGDIPSSATTVVLFPSNEEEQTALSREFKKLSDDLGSGRLNFRADYNEVESFHNPILSELALPLSGHIRSDADEFARLNESRIFDDARPSPFEAILFRKVNTSGKEIVSEETIDTSRTHFGDITKALGAIPELKNFAPYLQRSLHQRGISGLGTAREKFLAYYFGHEYTEKFGIYFDEGQQLVITYIDDKHIKIEFWNQKYSRVIDGNLAAPQFNNAYTVILDLKFKEGEVYTEHTSPVDITLEKFELTISDETGRSLLNKIIDFEQRVLKAQDHKIRALLIAEGLADEDLHPVLVNLFISRKLDFKQTLKHLDQNARLAFIALMTTSGLGAKNVLSTDSITSEDLFKLIEKAKIKIEENTSPKTLAQKQDELCQRAFNTLSPMLLSHLLENNFRRKESKERLLQEISHLPLSLRKILLPKIVSYLSSQNERIQNGFVSALLDNLSSAEITELLSVFRVLPGDPPSYSRLKQKFKNSQYSKRVGEFETKLDSFLGNASSTPNNAVEIPLGVLAPQKPAEELREDLRKIAKPLFIEEDYHEVLTYIHAIRTSEDSLSRIINCYRIKSNATKTDVALECNLAKITDENTLQAIAKNGFTLKSRLDAAKKLYKKNPGLLFGKNIPKDEPVAIAAALLKNSTTDVPGVRSTQEIFEHKVQLASPTSLEEKFFCLDVLTKAHELGVKTTIFQEKTAQTFDELTKDFGKSFDVIYRACFPNFSVNDFEKNIQKTFNPLPPLLFVLNDLKVADIFNFAQQAGVTPSQYCENLCNQLGIIFIPGTEPKTFEGYAKIISEGIILASSRLEKLESFLGENISYDKSSDLRNKIAFVKRITPSLPKPNALFVEVDLEQTFNDDKDSRKAKFDLMLKDETQRETLIKQALIPYDPSGARKYLEETAHPGFFTKLFRKIFFWTEWSRAATKLTQSAARVITQPEPIKKVVPVIASPDLSARPKSQEQTAGVPVEAEAKFATTPGGIVEKDKGELFGEETAGKVVADATSQDIDSSSKISRLLAHASEEPAAHKPIPTVQFEEIMVEPASPQTLEEVPVVPPIAVTLGQPIEADKPHASSSLTRVTAQMLAEGKEASEEELRRIAEILLKSQQEKEAKAKEQVDVAATKKGSQIKIEKIDGVNKEITAIGQVEREALISSLSGNNSGNNSARKGSLTSSSGDASPVTPKEIQHEETRVTASLG